MIYGDNKSGRGGTENVKPLVSCFCKSIKENLKLEINRQSIENMAPHSSTLAWKIPWMEEAGGLQSMRSLSLGHD